MRYHALATDYDGTIATHGIVDEATLAGLERLRASGRKLIMVTGRELAELKTVFPHLNMFEWVVAENGAQLYRPSDQESTFIGEPPPQNFIDELKRRGVDRLSVGGCIVATWEPYEQIVLATIRDLGLELKVIFNKGAVMVLPSHLNKASGLNVALKRMGLTRHEVVGVGDAENDHAFFSICECSAAVANALPAVKERADIVLTRDHGAGVVELIDRMLDDDLRSMEGKLPRHQFVLGHKPDGGEVRVLPYDNAVLIAGPSGSGKSTVAAALLERLNELHYQHCILDPEGDFDAYDGAIVVGSAKQAPASDEVLQVFKDPKTNVTVNMVGMPLADRPTYFVTLLSRLLDMRAAIGRPHWLLVDEAHHLLPTAWLPASSAVAGELNRLILVTVHPGEVSPDVLKLIKLVVAVGPDPGKTLNEFCQAVGDEPTTIDDSARTADQVLVWSREAREHCFVKPVPSHSDRRRHLRKYLEGELPPERSFYFRGREGKLKLRAQNLLLFMQLADGVDDDTWQFHLTQHDVSRWIAACIKDHTLADEAAAIESQTLPPDESRKRIRAAIEKRYTLPATSFLPMPGTDAKPQHS